MIIDSGFRCHLTSFSRTTAAAPSVFVTKLRRFLKTRRVTSVSQVGTDRIIEFQFSDGQYRLFLEFYASGNIILTDRELNILALLRIVPPGEGQEEQRMGLQYSLENRQNYLGVPPLTKERLRAGLQKAAEKAEDGAVAKKQRKKGGDALRKALAVSITEFPPLLVDHAMKVTDFDSTLKPADVANNDELLDHLLRSLEEAQRVIKEITSSDITTGYIIAKKGNREIDAGLSPAEQEEKARQNLLYEDFHPFKPRQFEDDPACIFLPFEGFNNTVDEFFSSIEGQRLESRLHERELTAKKKLEAAKREQQRRLGGLQEMQTLNERKAAAIEANVPRVQEAMDAVNGLIAQGMDWVEIGKLIEMEQKRRNPVASLIKLPLRLQENTITLLLDEESFADDSDDEGYVTESDVSESEDEAPSKQPAAKVADKRLTIDINLGMSPWSNAREYYDQKRSAADKEKKTLQSSTQALKSTAQKIEQDLKKGLKLEKPVLRPVRKPMWFEKFTWFISSDGYLVLGGRDAQQNEILYKKYLRKGDVYVHADLHGASSIVIRNNQATPDAPIPPSTLSQAGTLAVASSSAWDSKAGMSAWWVNADQVSKSAPTGEYLPTGSFMVRGKKNFLPPAQLVLGFGVLWQISDDSKANHTKHRVQEDESASATLSPRYESAEQSVQLEGEQEDNDRNASDDDKEEQSEGEGEDEDEDEDVSGPDARSNPLQSAPANPDETPNDLPASPPAPTEELRELSIQPDQRDDTNEPDVESPNPPTNLPTPPPKPKGPAPLPRGKRTKAKKAAQRYKDQDESDRLAAQALMGSSAGRAKADAEAAARAARDAEEEFNKERRKAQHARTQAEMARHEEARKATMLGEGEEEEEEERQEREKEGGLDNLVATALPGDEIVAAVAVCAPWAAMGRYKYKVKLQPGGTKKGKAVKEMLGRWAADAGRRGAVDAGARDAEKMWPREVELLAGLRAEEVVGVVPVGKVRVVVAGGGAKGDAGGPKGRGRGKGNGGKGGR